MFGRNKSRRRPRHRVERRQGRRAQGRRQGLQGHRLRAKPVPPDSIVDGAIIDGAAVADAIRRLFDSAGIQDQGGRGLALGQRRHRQEDQPAGDDRGRAGRVDLLGSRAVHPVRHPGRQPRLPDPRPGDGADARARWTCCSSRRRRTRSPTTPASSPRPGATPVVVDVDAFALQNAYEVNYGLEPGAVVVLLNAGASAININIVSGDQSRLHPRHLDRRQRLHRGRAEAS